MAEKGFGVKEINLIGASGTPTIESPNNLNLNAINVAISTNVSIGGTLSVTGNVSIGGTLTYEDVTNIDSVGLITARSGIVVGAGKSILVGAGVTISSSTKGDIQISGIATAQSFNAPYTGAGSGFSMEGGAYNNGYYINSSGNTLIGMAYFSNNTIGLSGNGSSPLSFIIDDVASISLNPSSGACALNYAGSGKLQTSPAGITVTGAVNATGIITATNSVHVKSSDSSPGRIDLYCESGNSHYIRLQAPTHSNFSGNLTITLPNSSGTLLLNNGDGSNLTGIAVTEAPVVDYTITAPSASAYRFHGGGVDETADDPDLYLIRGQKYRFNNTTGSGHPFRFSHTGNANAAYSNGVTGSEGGVQFWTIPYDAPAKLFYVCTLHPAMVGNIYIRGANGQNENVGLTTFSGVSISSNGATVTPSGYDLKIRSNTAKLGIHVDNSSGTPTLEFGIGGATGGAITTNSSVGGIFLKPNNTDILKVENLGIRAYASVIDTSYHANPDPFGDGSGIVYYRLNDNFHDSGIFAQHGTSRQGGDPTFAFVNSDGERCWNNPADGAITIPNLKNSYPFTMAAWVNLSSWPTTSNNDLIMNLSIGGQRVSLCIVKWTDRSTSDPSIMYGGANHHVFPASSRPTNEWIHLVYSVVASNDTGHAVYQNGSALSDINKGPTHGGSAGWAIGGNASNTERFEIGRIGSIRFFNKAISSSEASALYTNDKFYT